MTALDRARRALLSGRASPQTMRRLHLGLTILWAVSIVPTVLWWKDSILWVAILSVWANVAAHWSAYQGAGAQQAVEEEARP